MKKEKLEDILLREMSVVYKCLCKMGATKEDAEDIVQDTLCKAIEYMDALNLDEPITSWLFKVSLNRFYNLTKRNKRVVLWNDSFIEKLLSEEGVESKVLRKEEREKVHSILYQLKDSYRNLLIMKYEMSLSYREIGQLLNIPDNQVQTYLYRARNKFKEYWEGQIDGE